MSCLNSLIKLLFPTFCIGCGDYGNILCTRCQNQLYVALPECFYCRRLSKGFISHRCREFLDEDKAKEVSEILTELPITHISQVFVCYIYNWLGKTIMKKLKFESVTILQERIISLIGPRKDELIKVLAPNGVETYIIPIPLSKKRLISRGYNQIEFFAKYLSEIGVGKYNDKLLLRTDSSKSQSHKTLAERQFHGANPFEATAITAIQTEQVQKLCFIIVDDVITTGNTLKYAAEALQQQYPAAEIKAIALFRPTFKGKREPPEPQIPPQTEASPNNSPTQHQKGAPVLPDASTLPP